MIPSGISHVRRLLAVLALLASGVASANPEPWQLNLTPGVTETSRQVYGLHMLAFWVCVAIGVVVFGAMIIAPKTTTPMATRAPSPSSGATAPSSS